MTRIATSYAAMLLLELGRGPRSYALHILTAAICGLLMLPDARDGYATLTVGGHPIAYTSDSVGVIIGTLFASFYPIAGATLLTTTLRNPIPEELLSTLPVRRFALLLGRFLAGSALLGAHVLFLTAAGSVRGLGLNGLEGLPRIAATALAITLPTIAMTATLGAVASRARREFCKSGAGLAVPDEEAPMAISSGSYCLHAAVTSSFRGFGSNGAVSVDRADPSAFHRPFT